MKGETEMLKVGSVISAKLMIRQPCPGSPSGTGFETTPGTTYLGPSQPARVNRLPGLPQADRSFLNQNPTPFPVPVPYPRPHP